MCGCGGSESVGASGLPVTSLLCRFCQRLGCCGPQPGAAGVSGAGMDYPGLGMATFDNTTFEDLSSALQSATNALGGLGASSTGDGAIEQVHVLSAGEGALKSTANVSGNGTSCSSSFAGSVYQLPVQGGLAVEVDLGAQIIRATVQVAQPAEMGLQEFRYRMVGVVDIPDSPGFAVSNLVLDPATDIAGAAAAGIGTMGIGFWCALRCGGLRILGTLVTCLPAFFAGGPAGFIACVVSRIGETGAGIAQCIARECLS